MNGENSIDDMEILKFLIKNSINKPKAKIKLFEIYIKIKSFVKNNVEKSEKIKFRNYVLIFFNNIIEHDKMVEKELHKSFNLTLEGYKKFMNLIPNVPLPINGGIKRLGINVIRDAAKIFNEIHNDLDIVSVGSGTGFLEVLLFDNECFCVDPDPSYFQKGEVIKNDYAKLIQCLLKNPNLTNNCGLVLNMPNGGGIYDIESIIFLNPKKILLIFLPNASVGGGMILKKWYKMQSKYDIIYEEKNNDTYFFSEEEAVCAVLQLKSN